MSDFAIHVLLLVTMLCLTINAAIHHRLLSLIMRRMALQDELVSQQSTALVMMNKLLNAYTVRLDELTEKIDG